MRISHKHKFVYIAIPKTASTTIRQCLNKFSDVNSVIDSHSPLYHHVKPTKLKEYFEEQNWNWDEYFKFAFVRNPWDVVVSWIHYGGYSMDAGWASPTNLKKFPKYYWYPRCEWLFADDRCLVDFIGRFENLQEDFNIVCDKLGIPRQELPCKNPTKHKHYTEYYNDETRKIVAEKFAKDIEHFGYEFGE